jgi:hypothetical protein
MARAGQVAAAALEAGGCAVAGGEAARSDNATAPPEVQCDKLGDLIDESDYSGGRGGAVVAWRSNKKDTAPSGKR